MSGGLRQTAEEYLAMRRAMGFKLNRHARILRDFVEHLAAGGQETITTSVALEWAIRPAGHPQEWEPIAGSVGMSSVGWWWAQPSE